MNELNETMVIADQFDADSLRKTDAKIFLDMVKHHYASSTFDKCNELEKLLKEAGNLTSSDQEGINSLLSDVRTLFNESIYLIHEFKRFLPNGYPRITSAPVVPKTRSYDLKQCNSKRKKEILDFLKTVKSTVDHKVFRKLLERTTAYQKYRLASVRGVKKRELVDLLKDHHDLKHKLDAMLSDEDDLLLVDTSLHRMLSARDAALDLIGREQSFTRRIRGKVDKTVRDRGITDVTGYLKEELDVTKYYSQVDLKCIKDALQGSTILADESMSRGMAVEDSMEITSWLSNKIQEVREMWWTGKEMDDLLEEGAEDEIPKWDWHEELSEDKFQDLPPIVWSDSDP